MKTTARATIHPAPPASVRSARPRPSPAADSTTSSGTAGLGAAISDALQGHRRRLGLAPRAYAARRAWTLGFLLRVLTDPGGLRVCHVVAALEGTGWMLTVAPLPTDLLPGAGPAVSSPRRGGDAQPGPVAPVTRLPTHACPGDVVADAVVRLA